MAPTAKRAPELSPLQADRLHWEVLPGAAQVELDFGNY